MSGNDPLWEFIKSLDYDQLDQLEFAINFHISRHIERGKTDDFAKISFADLIEFMASSYEEICKGLQEHGQTAQPEA